jgi:hypothetical protein
MKSESLDEKLESLIWALDGAKKRSFRKFCEDAQSVEENIEVLSRYVIPLSRDLELIDLKLTRIEHQVSNIQKVSNPFKAPVLVAIVAALFPLYITTSQYLWIILIDVAVFIYLALTIWEGLKARQELLNAMDKLVAEYSQLKEALEQTEEPED